jgi:hypothetical protein
MPLCDHANWKHHDKINDLIWKHSPQRQMELAQQFSVTAQDDFGGQQAMFTEGNHLGSPTNPLPWVPDLVGKKSDQENAVMIIGSAYAPFVANYTRRARRMNLLQYINAEDWWGFLSGEAGFLANVMGQAGNGDDEHNYYGRLANMLDGAQNDFDLQRIILTDWCRASFVKRAAVAADGVRPDQGGDKICRWEVFNEYFLKNCDWHKRRLENFDGRIVLLGNLSHRCLQNACAVWEWPVTYHDIAGVEVQPPPKTIGAFWNDGHILRFGRIARGQNRTLEFVAVWHPSARGQNFGWVEGLRNWVDLNPL